MKSDEPILTSFELPDRMVTRFNLDIPRYWLVKTRFPRLRLTFLVLMMIWDATSLVRRIRAWKMMKERGISK